MQSKKGKSPESRKGSKSKKPSAKKSVAIKGKTTNFEQALNKARYLDRLSEKELLEIQRQIFQVANKRITRAKKSKVWLFGDMTRFNAKKTTSGARIEIARAKAFLSNPNSQVAFAKETRKTQIEALTNAGVVGLNMENFDEIFAIYERIAEEDPSIKLVEGKYENLSDIADHLRQGELTPNEIVELFKKKLSPLDDDGESLRKTPRTSKFTAWMGKGRK